MFLLYDQKVRKINETVSKSMLYSVKTSQLNKNNLGRSKYYAYRKINKSSRRQLFIFSTVYVSQRWEIWKNENGINLDALLKSWNFINLKSSLQFCYIIFSVQWHKVSIFYYWIFVQNKHDFQNLHYHAT